MKTVKEYSETAKRDVHIDVDALLAAINEISESEVHRVDDEDGQRVSVDGREYHTPDHQRSRAGHLRRRRDALRFR